MSLLLPFTIAAILTTDPLGYECVPEDRLEAAFAAGGKGMRAPQTCIPDPCKQTFSDVTLASYTGFQDAAAYTDYRRRMTSVCGTPTLWEDRGLTDQELMWAVFDGGSGPILLPEQVRYASSGGAAGSGDRPGIKRGAGGSQGHAAGRGFGAGGGRSSFVSPPHGRDPFPDPFSERPEPDNPDVPTHAPLPAPFFLLGAAAAALVLVKRLARRVRSPVVSRG